MGVKRGGWSISLEGAGVRGCAGDAGTIARRRHKDGDSRGVVDGRVGSHLVSGLKRCVANNACKLARQSKSNSKMRKKIDTQKDVLD